jgi:hypothetical protein
MPRIEKKSVLPLIKKQVSVSNTVSSAVERPAVERPGLLNSMKQGFGFGLGNSLAHRLFTPNNIIAPAKNIEFKQCIEKPYTTYEDCAHLIE